MTKLTTVDPKTHLMEFLGYEIDKVINQLELAASDVVFWSGSLVEGFGNKMSDVDLYLIGSTHHHKTIAEVTGPNFPLMERLLLHVGKRIDITFIPPVLIAKVGKYLSEYQSVDYADDWSENLREFVHRIKIGMPLVNCQKFYDYRNQIDFNKYHQYLISWYQKRVDSLMDDVVGALECGESHTAMFCARERLRFAIDLYLVTKGETNTRCNKWRWKKLMQCNSLDDPIVRDFLLAEGVGSVLSLNDRTNYCQNLTERILLDAI